MISVIVPCYNEVKTIQSILEKLIRFTSDYNLEIIVVDDCSDDGTTELLKSKYSDVKISLIFHKVSKGKRAALRKGLLHSKVDIITIQDADLEYLILIIVPLSAAPKSHAHGAERENDWRCRVYLFLCRFESPDQPGD